MYQFFKSIKSWNENTIIFETIKLYEQNTEFWNSYKIKKDYTSYKFDIRCFVHTVDKGYSVTIENKTNNNETINVSNASTKVKYNLDNKYKSYEPNTDIKYLKISEYYVISDYMFEDVLDYLINKKYYKAIVVLYAFISTNNNLCHYAFNKKMLDILFNNNNYIESSPFEKYHEIIYRSMFYAFYILNNEEFAINDRANKKYRFVINIDNLKYLNIQKPINQHPLFPFTLNNNQIYSNLLLKPIKTDLPRGVYSNSEFWHRFDIFSDGILKNINVSNIGFSGSCITACVIKNPLEHLYNSLEDYFNEYYPSKSVIKTLPNNMNDIMGLEDNLSDIDIIVETKDQNEFIKKVNSIYNTIKENLLEKHKEIKDYDLMLIKVSTLKSFKYFISGKLIKRSIEIYKTPHDLMGEVCKYHFSCVRAIALPKYTNKILFGDCLLFPSFISTAYTGIMVDYRFVGQGVLLELYVLKYYIRGFYALLNYGENDMMKEYIKIMEKWKNILKYLNYEYIDINNPLFHPSKIGINNYYDLPSYNKIKNRKWITITKNFDEIYKSNKSKLRTETGHINTLKIHEVIKAIEN